ncbi:MAG: AbrB/MazE/SpoVT family DNA-binding domain-containing protein [Candidatus Woesearchaeota archaeon]|nr:AbrB/MazE/SpoVT family DNA-binding domain-containing protein [Candidatus Woesearchaeota archaeon]
MKRKIVQHGPSTLTISLPADWAREHNVQKGDEISVERVNQGLLLTSEKGVRLKQKKLSLKSMNAAMIAQLVCSLYKQGYDELKIMYDAPEEADAIYELVRKGSLNFEITENTKDTIELRNLIEPVKGEFKTLFRRIFYFLLTTAEESTEAIENENTELSRDIVRRHEHVIRIAAFCTRLIAKYGQDAYESDTLVWQVIETLEGISAAYAELHQLILDDVVTSSEVLHNACEQLSISLRAYEALFFRFSLERSTEFFNTYEELHARVAVCEPYAQRILMQVAQKLRDLSAITFALQA